MKYLLTFFLLFLFVLPSSAQDSLMVQKNEPSTFYFIRHAEKDRSDKTDRNPHLIQTGLLRSAKWSYVLENVKFDAIYSTDYNRTKETAGPTAEKNEIDITLYDPRNIDGNAFKTANQGKTVLVVGHSNTTPMFVNAILGMDKYPQIDDSNNANLYIVTISGSGEVTDVLLVID